MTIDLESRLRSQLQAESSLLSEPDMSFESVGNRGRQRQRRASFATAAGCFVVLAGALALVLPATLASNDQPEIVLAQQPEVSESSGDEVLVVEDQTFNPTSEAITQLPEQSVLFHTDHEGCDELPDRRSHPDWQQGQSSDETNDDGTPTYGFAYTRGRVASGDIDWKFAEQNFALSGSCVVAMTLNHADTESPAVRLIRRYDADGNELPADAFYSAWMYFPEEIAMDTDAFRDGELIYGFWSIFQFENQVETSDAALGPLTTFSVNTGRLPDEDFMALSVYNKTGCGLVEECSEANTIVQEDPITIPLEQWVHFEIEIQSRPDETGRMVIWQDGQRIIDFEGQTERANTVQRTWSVQSMGQLHNTPTHTLYADDPLIAAEPIHPYLFE